MSRAHTQARNGANDPSPDCAYTRLRGLQAKRGLRLRLEMCRTSSTTSEGKRGCQAIRRSCDLRRVGKYAVHRGHDGNVVRLWISCNIVPTRFKWNLEGCPQPECWVGSLPHRGDGSLGERYLGCGVLTLQQRCRADAH